jgi:1,4-alpha-glucan branching enzyme
MKEDDMIEVQQNTGDKLRLVKFSYASAPGHTVALAGVFNDWDSGKVLMVYSKDAGCYCCELPLAPGRYEYKLVVDGEWLLDESNPNFASNDFGTLNSVVTVE